MTNNDTIGKMLQQCVSHAAKSLAHATPNDSLVEQARNLAMEGRTCEFWLKKAHENAFRIAYFEMLDSAQQKSAMDRALSLNPKEKIGF